ncbi:MAG: heparinase II/III domain-containing protein, partial [Notoacmeibacter sp.]
DDFSSSVFTGNERLKRLMGSALVRGPSMVTVKRQDAPGAQTFLATHNGYAPMYDLIHEREVTLLNEGNTILGIDRLLPAQSARKKADQGKVAIRFHLHPDIHVLVNGSGELMLMADNDDSWSFSADGVTPKLIETFFFAKLSGPQKSKAITLEFGMSERAEVRWALTRTGVGARYL